MVIIFKQRKHYQCGWFSKGGYLILPGCLHYRRKFEKYCKTYPHYLPKSSLLRTPNLSRCNKKKDVHTCKSCGVTEETENHILWAEITVRLKIIDETSKLFSRYQFRVLLTPYKCGILPREARELTEVVWLLPLSPTWEAEDWSSGHYRYLTWWQQAFSPFLFSRLLVKKEVYLNRLQRQQAAYRRNTKS